MEPFIQLEHEIAKWACPDWHVVACSSGTAALHLAMEALQLPPGSEVVVPDFTMIACPRAVAMAGLKPVFVDCGDDLLIDCELVEKAASELKYARSSIRAIMPVHIYGRVCDMTKVMEIAKRYDLFVVEDMAEAHGVKPHPGSDAACWSFYKNKIVHGEEGGAVAFRCKEHADYARRMRNLGFTDKHDFNHAPRGCNYRLANLLAKPILRSLQDFEMSVRLRRLAEAKYDELCPPEWRMPKRESPWVYDLRIKGLKDLDEVVTALNEEGIAARHSFKPMCSQKEFFGTSASVGACGDKSLTASREVFYLPLDILSLPVGVKKAFEVVKRTARFS